MPTYSDRQLAEARSLVSKYAANDGHRLVVAEDHAHAHGRALTAELIKRGRVTRLCLELPRNLHSDSHSPPVSEQEMAMMRNVIRVLSPGGQTSSSSASSSSSLSSSSSSAASTSRVDYAKFFGELNERLAKLREPIDLSTQEGWAPIKAYLDQRFDACGNPIKLSRLIEFAYAHRAEVQLVDGDYQWAMPAASLQRSHQMVAAMQSLPASTGELLLVGSQHADHMRDKKTALVGQTHFIQVMEPDIDDSDSDSDD